MKYEVYIIITDTNDVQDLLVSEWPGGGINVSIVYVEGTLSPGALVCVLPHTNGDLTNIKLVFIPRSKSDNFIIPVPSGEYRVIAFDLESETLPRLPLSKASISEGITLMSDIEGSYCVLLINVTILENLHPMLL